MVVGVVLGVTVGATPTDSEPPSSTGAGWASPPTSVKITSWSVNDVKPTVSPVKVTNAKTPEPMGPAGSGWSETQTNWRMPGPIAGARQVTMRSVLERNVPGSIPLTDAMAASKVSVTWKAPNSGELAIAIS